MNHVNKKLLLLWKFVPFISSVTENCDVRNFYRSLNAYINLNLDVSSAEISKEKWHKFKSKIFFSFFTDFIDKCENVRRLKNRFPGTNLSTFPFPYGQRFLHQTSRKIPNLCLKGKTNTFPAKRFQKLQKMQN